MDCELPHLSRVPLLILSKITAHWLLTGIPIILLSPLLGLFLFLNNEGVKVLMLTLLLATPSLSQKFSLKNPQSGFQKKSYFSLF
jgi:heme exporter protein CcmB